MGRDVIERPVGFGVGDGDVPGPEEDDGRGHVPLLDAESEKEISYLE